MVIGIACLVFAIVVLCFLAAIGRSDIHR